MTYETGDSIRANAIADELAAIEREVTLGEYSKANLLFLESFGYNPYFQMNENAVCAVQEGQSNIRALNLAPDEPETYAVLELGRSIADDMDVVGSYARFEEQITRYAMLDDKDRRLVSQLLKKGNYFDITARLATADNQAELRQELVDLLPKRKRSSFRARTA